MEALLEFTEPWLYILIFLLAAAEGAFLVGLVLPGETSMLVGGVVVYEGSAEGWLIYTCGIVGAIAGDSVGYWIGRRFGGRVRASRLGEKVGDDRWERAATYVRERGGRAVFIGRFAGFLRTLVPPMAGHARMPYARFVAFNAPAATLWAVSFISLGVVAGNSWHVVDVWAGRGSAFIATLLVAVGGAFLAGRWLIGHRDTAVAHWERLLDAPLVRTGRKRFARQIAFMKRRFDPTERFGLYFSVGVIATLAVGVVSAEFLDALQEGDELGRLDRSVADFARENRSGSLDRVVDAVEATLNGVTLAAAAVAAGGIAWKVTGRASWFIEGIAAASGAIFLDDLVRIVLEVGGFRSPDGFPSGDATAAMVVTGFAIYVAARSEGWRTAVLAGAAGSTLLIAVLLARVYDGVLPSALLGGVLLGLLWIAICGVGFTQLAAAGADPS